jgi:transposase
MGEVRLTGAQRQRLRRQLKETQDAHVYRRTLAVLEVAQGKPIAHVAQSLGVSRESIYNWLDAYGASHDPGELWDGERSGRPSLWTDETEAALRVLLGQAPDDLGYYAVNWTVPLLREQLQESTEVQFSDDTIRRELRRLGYVWKRGRYELEPDPELEKKTPDTPTDTEFAASERLAG